MTAIHSNLSDGTPIVIELPTRDPNHTAEKIVALCEAIDRLGREPDAFDLTADDLAEIFVEVDKC